MRLIAAAVTAIAMLSMAANAGAFETVSHGRFEKIALYVPKAAARQFVLLLSDSAGWNAAMDETAEALAAQGAMVAGIDVAAFEAKLHAERSACTFPDGDFENLSHHLQAEYKLPTYLTPLIAGRGEGAAMAYALAAQAPAATFGGLITLGFCPRLALRKPLCKGLDVHFRPAVPPRSLTALPSVAAPALSLLPAKALTLTWAALPAPDQACSPGTAHGFVDDVDGARWLTSVDGVPALKTAYDEVAAGNSNTLPPPPASLADLPLIEVPATVPGTRFAVLISGDGGWAGIDKKLAAALAAQGVPVAGFDSLRYFWQKRTPAGLARDIDRVVRYYAARWNRPEVLLIGYSQGADVLPFAINRLSRATRSMVRLHALLSPGQKAAFEFHVGNWLGPSGDEPILPEAVQLDAADTFCLYGAAEKDSLCPALAPAHAQVLSLAGGHHYTGDFASLATLILERVPAK